MSRILILVGSPRKGGNTAQLAAAFAAGASARHEVETVQVTDYAIAPCLGCNACQRQASHACIQDDDMRLIYDKLMRADTLIIASPVYFYGLSSQLKAVIDRLHTPLRDDFAVKRLGLLLVGAASLPNLFDAITCQYQMVLDYFALEDVGRILVPAVKDIGDITGHPALEEAYALGATLQPLQ